MPYKDREKDKAAKLRWYYRNKEKVRLGKHKRYEIIKNFLIEAKNKPCADCHSTYPFYVMDFDHLDASLKIDNVGGLVNYSLKKVKEEIAKCELICSNCHRIRTWNRKHMSS